ncbi:MAG: RNA 3'-phosphate cyclase [Chlamydiae bacterium CG10_big_fil_rev_8_21_14_0_10_35_9]|nr:MAG: RNA 3'-phosphate cyclase [Chlamydiae bacterium CG10_big_fil_rev_8_21_14_0_10_35_9]
MIKIDGSQKSGSGTIVRYAIGLASLLSKNLHLTNIRVKREKKGLRPQHLKAIEACCEMTGGSLEKAEVGSLEIFYHPGKTIKGGRFKWDIGTAGSATMLAQTVLPLAAFAEKSSQIEIIGGLFQDFAPAAFHLEHVVFPLYRKMGLNVHLEIVRPGYVPQGEGIIQMYVDPVNGPLTPLTLPIQGNIEKIEGISFSSHLEENKVSDRMAESCLSVLKEQGYNADITCYYDTTAKQRGAVLTVYATTDAHCIIGADKAGKLGRSSENIGKTVAKMLLKDLATSATVDRHTADQLILYAALAKGESKYRIPFVTDHVSTNLWLVKSMIQTNYSLTDNLLTIKGINY